MPFQAPDPSPAVPAHSSPSIEPRSAAGLDVFLPPFAAPATRQSVQAAPASAPPAAEPPSSAEPAVPAWLDMLDGIEDEDAAATPAEPETVELESLLESRDESPAPYASVADDAAAGVEEQSHVSSTAGGALPEWMDWRAGDEDAAPQAAVAPMEEVRAVAETAEPEPWSVAAEPSAAVERTPLVERGSAVDGTLVEVATRLERLAETLRTGGLEALAHDTSDPLALLVTGFALGSMRRSASS